MHTFLLVTHILVAVLGVGSATAVAIVATTARRRGRDAVPALSWLRPLLLYSSFSLALMLLTGILLVLVTNDAIRSAWWIRGSVLLLLATGALGARARRAVRRGLSNEVESALALRRVEFSSYGMCALVAGIVVLMTMKPF
jgi:hypothetical protein